jgi:hypothetical protein
VRYSQDHQLSGLMVVVSYGSGRLSDTMKLSVAVLNGRRRSSLAHRWLSFLVECGPWLPSGYWRASLAGHGLAFRLAAMRPCIRRRLHSFFGRLLLFDLFVLLLNYYCYSSLSVPLASFPSSSRVLLLLHPFSINTRCTCLAGFLPFLKNSTCRRLISSFVGPPLQSFEHP